MTGAHCIFPILQMTQVVTKASAELGTLATRSTAEILHARLADARRGQTIAFRNDFQKVGSGVGPPLGNGVLGMKVGLEGLRLGFVVGEGCDVGKIRGPCRIGLEGGVHIRPERRVGIGEGMRCGSGHGLVRKIFVRREENGAHARTIVVAPLAVLQDLAAEAKVSATHGRLQSASMDMWFFHWDIIPAILQA